MTKPGASTAFSRWERELPHEVEEVAGETGFHLREGSFQRSLCLLVAATSVVSGAEVGYEHYKGSYSNPVMYSPVILSGVLTVAGAAGFFSAGLARTFLRWTSAITLADGIIGVGFHIRGIARKPGGWRLPLTNIVMGPPVLAPLLFGTSAYLGLIASYLRREEESGWMPRPGSPHHLSVRSGAIEHERINWKQDLREGRFQRHLALITALWTFCSGFEAWYSHYKDRFKYKVQWTPVLLTPLMVAAALGAIPSRRIGHTLLPAVSAVAMLNGTVGFFYHARGIKRRPGGLKTPVYNVLYGPPIFAPMLFAACGMLGLLASLMRRERR